MKYWLHFIRLVTLIKPIFSIVTGKDSWKAANLDLWQQNLTNWSETTENTESGIRKRNWNRRWNHTNKNWSWYDSATDNNCSSKIFHLHMLYFFHIAAFCSSRRRKSFLREFHIAVNDATYLSFRIFPLLTLYSLSGKVKINFDAKCLSSAKQW